MPTRLRNVLVWVHRYVGIPMSAVFVLWFVSGLVMIYTGGMPSLSPDDRLAHRAPLDLEAVAVSARDASEAVGFAPTRMRLLTVMGRPAYRLDTPLGGATVFADTGEPLDELGRDAAREVASRYTGLPRERLRYLRTLTRPDQWTLTISGALPLVKLAANDAAHTEIYVSPYTAEVELVTSRLDRALAWAGAIPHWFYVTPLRTHAPIWYWTVVVTALLGTVLALVGLVLGIADLRAPRPFRLRALSPFTGWLRWHHLLGLVFGLLTLTWVFSGLLSMEPFDWTRMDGAEPPRGALRPGTLDPARFPAIDVPGLSRAAGGGTIKELELLEIRGAPYYLARSANTDTPRLLAAATLEPRTHPFDAASIVAGIERALPEYPVLASSMLEQYDAYYYARGGDAPLPVLRVKLGDAAATWLYVDAVRDAILARFNRRERLERWLYHGLHSLDFGFWYDRRPLWDLGVITLALGALTASALGLYLGLGRIRRFVRRARGPMKRRLRH